MLRTLTPILTFALLSHPPVARAAFSESNPAANLKADGWIPPFAPVPSEELTLVKNLLVQSEDLLSPKYASLGLIKDFNPDSAVDRAVLGAMREELPLDFYPRVAAALRSTGDSSLSLQRAVLIREIGEAAEKACPRVLFVVRIRIQQILRMLAREPLRHDDLAHWTLDLGRFKFYGPNIEKETQLLDHFSYLSHQIPLEAVPFIRDNAQKALLVISQDFDGMKRDPRLLQGSIAPEAPSHQRTPPQDEPSSASRENEFPKSSWGIALDPRASPPLHQSNWAFVVHMLQEMHQNDLFREFIKQKDGMIYVGEYSRELPGNKVLRHRLLFENYQRKEFQLVMIREIENRNKEKDSRSRLSHQLYIVHFSPLGMYTSRGYITQDDFPNLTPNELVKNFTYGRDMVNAVNAMVGIINESVRTSRNSR